LSGPRIYRAPSGIKQKPAEPWMPGSMRHWARRKR
jgi:hypothetical protein